MLKLTGLCKTFGTHRAVCDVNLSVSAGEMVAIIGRSGAGKSTLLRLINRLEEPSAGAIECREKNISHLRGFQLRLWRRECAMIFQEFNLVDRLDVISNVLIGRVSYHYTLSTLFGVFNKAERAMAVGALARLQLLPQVFQRADTLSGGQKQRVAIARALTQRPSIILADEPTASLDPVSGRQVMAALKQINEREHLTVLCNLHHLEMAETYCRRIVGMAHGRVVFDGAPRELTKSAVRFIYERAEDDQEASAPSAHGKAAIDSTSIEQPSDRLSLMER